MISLSDIIKELEELKETVPYEVDMPKEDWDKRNREIKRRIKRHEFLVIIRNYLETSPSEDFLKKEKLRLTNEINVLHDRYPLWKNNNFIPSNVKKPETYYSNLMGVPAIRKQIKNIEYILG